MLPKIELPVYEVKLPSSGQIIKIRPFTVKEEKLLLMAAESGDNDDIINTTIQVINNCLIDDSVNITKLPFFDIDYLFIALRAKSVGESIDIKFTCNNKLEDGSTCGHIFPAKIDISNCKLDKDESIEDTIKLSGTMSVKMRYPTYSVMKSLIETMKDIDKEVHIIANSIEMIQDKDSIYTLKDMTKDEMIQFVESLTQEQYKKMENYVDNFPSFLVTAEADCPKCGFHHNLEYRSFESFFV